MEHLVENFTAMKLLQLFSIAFLFSFSSYAQQVSTLLNSSSQQVDDAVIMDRYGNIYGSHFGGSNVYKITPTGSVSVYKSGFNTPNGLAFDSQDNLYVADNMAHRVFKVDTAGTTVFGVSVSNVSGIIKELDSDTMIVTQYLSNAIRKVAPDGTILPQMHFGAPLNGPVGLAYALDSNLYVGNFNNRIIYRYRNDSLEYVATVPGSSGDWLGFITHANGMLYGTVLQTHKVYEIDPNYVDSVRLFAGSTAGNTDGNVSIAQFNQPNGIYGSKGGDSLLVSDAATGNIRLITGLVTGIYNEKIISFSTSIFPNPSQGELTVLANEKINAVDIYTLNGQLVYQLEGVNTERVEINENLERGHYFIRIRTRKGVENRKLIITN